MEIRWHRPTFPTAAHERVHDLLRRLISEGTAQFFADACDLTIREPAFRTKAHLVSHLLREVESTTRSVLKTLPAAKARLQQITSARGLGQDGNPYQPSHREDIDAILGALALTGHGVAGQWASFAGKQSFAKTAHRSGVGLPRRFDATVTQNVDRFVEAMSAVLDAVEAKYGSILTSLDNLRLKDAPDNRDVEEAKALLAPGVTALSHFFEQLTVAWLPPLRQAGLFSEPVFRTPRFAPPSPTTDQLRRV